MRKFLSFQKLLAFVLCLCVASPVFARGGGSWATWARRPWAPRDVPGVLTWLRADVGVTTGATPVASGTTPPAATLTGSGVPLCFQIDGAGARGTATFKYSVNDCSTFIATNVLTAATVALTGAASAITVNFPVGTYATDNVYKATVATWADTLSGLATSVAQATASTQPVYSGASGAGSRPTVIGDGVDDILSGGSGATTQPTTVFFVGRWRTAFSAQSSIFDGGGGNRLRFFRTGSTTATIFAGASFAQSSLTPTANHYYTIGFNGASSTFRYDAANDTSGSAGANAGLGLRLFAFGSISDWSNSSIDEIIIVNAIPTTIDRNAVEQYLKVRYGL